MKSKSENDLPSQKPKPLEEAKVNRRMKKGGKFRSNPLLHRDSNNNLNFSIFDPVIETTENGLLPIEELLVKEKVAETDFNIDAELEKLNLTNKSQIKDESFRLDFDFDTLDSTIIVTTGKTQSKIVEHLLAKEKVVEIDTNFDGEFEKQDLTIKPQKQNLTRKLRSQSVSITFFQWSTNLISTKTIENKEQKSKESELQPDNVRNLWTL
ncbi:MAG: hypothetical protein H0T84_10190 [Tatlockia sp.]|nr:hypothetical protein [Tatlockia sp.]